MEIGGKSPVVLSNEQFARYYKIKSLPKKIMVKKKCFSKDSCGKCEYSESHNREDYSDSRTYIGCCMDELEKLIEDTEISGPIKFYDAGTMKVKVIFVVNGENIKNAENDFINRVVKEGIVKEENTCIRNRGYGVPDFYVPTDKGKKFYEVKGPKDGLRVSQVKWLLNNLDKDVTLVYYGSPDIGIESCEVDNDNIMDDLELNEIHCAICGELINETEVQRQIGTQIQICESCSRDSGFDSGRVYTKCHECNGTGIIDERDYEEGIISGGLGLFDEHISIDYFKPTGNDSVQFLSSGIRFQDLKNKSSGIDYIVKVINPSKNSYYSLSNHNVVTWAISSHPLIKKLRYFIPLKGKTFNIQRKGFRKNNDGKSEENWIVEQIDDIIESEVIESEVRKVNYV